MQTKKKSKAPKKILFRVLLSAALALVLAAAVCLTFFLTGKWYKDREAALNAKASEALESLRASYEEEREGALFDLDLLLQVDKIARENALTPPEKEALTEALLTAYAQAFGDKNTLYYSAEQYLSVTEEQNGSFVGIGVSVRALDETHATNGKLLVLSVFDGSPAAEIGILPGDVLTAADGVSFEGMTAAEAAKLVKGEAGTSVTLTAERNGERLSFTAVRRTVTETCVYSRMMENGIAYIRITDFTRVTAAQFASAMKATEDAKGIVFDLRSNPGGYVTSLVDCLSALLPNGPILHVNYAKESASYHYEKKDGELLYVHSDGTYDLKKTECDASGSLTRPCAVLIDRHTASAGEAFAAALRDYTEKGALNARLFGETSYGKGSVQITYKLENNAAFRLTVATYDPPYGENYHGVGVAPNEFVALHSGYEGALPETIPSDKDAPLAAALEWLSAQK